MKNNRTLQLILVALVIGGALEFIKGFGAVELREGNRLSNMDIRDIDTKPFLRKNSEQDSIIKFRNSGKVRPSGFLAANVDKTAITELDKEKSAARGAKEEKDKKKKKKKKAKTDKAQADELVVETKPEAPKKSKPSDDSLNNGTGGAVLADPSDQNPDADILADWLKRLSLRPNSALMTEFIREYQSGKITANVFYAVIESLLTESNSEFHSLAISAAVSSASPRSFNILARIALGDQFGPRAISEAVSGLNAYQSIQLVWVPRMVLENQTGPEGLLVLSANLINQSTEKYLSTGEVSDSDPSPSRGGFLAQALKVFSQIAPSIEQAIARFQNQPNISAPLQSALDRIRLTRSVAGLPN